MTNEVTKLSTKRIDIEQRSGIEQRPDIRQRSDITQRSDIRQQSDIEQQSEATQQSLKPLKPLKPLAYQKQKACLVAVVALQIAIMCGTAVPAAMTLNNGKIVTLKTIPVDPYDMFRGDYVRLGYDISNVKLSPPPTDGASVYVALEQKGRYWYPRTASTNKPTLLPGEICIRGKYLRAYQRVHYGIEQVFVPEKTGHAAERAKSLTVEVAVDDAGNSAIRRVMNDNQTIYDAKKVIFGRP